MPNSPTVLKKSSGISQEETKKVTTDIGKTVQSGQAPSNDQLNALIDTTEKVIEKEASKVELNPHGARAVKDVQNILESAQTLLNEKNKDEKLQRLIANAKKASESPSLYASYRRVSREVKGQQGKMEDIQDQFSDIYRNISNVAYQIVRSSDFRTILIDFIRLVQDTGAKKMDEISKDPKAQPVDKMEGKQEKPLGDLVSEVTEDTYFLFLKIERNLAKDVGQDIKEGNLPVDEERKQELYDRWDALFQKFIQNKEFHHAMHGFFNIFDMLSDQADRLKNKVENEGEQMKRDQYLNQIWQDTRDLIGEFSGREKLDLFLNDSWSLWYSIRDDPELSSYFNELRAWFEETLEHPEKLQDKELYKQKSQDFVYRAQDIFQKWKYQEDLNRMLDQGTDVLHAIRLDPTTLNFVDTTKKFAKDLILDEYGRPSLQVTTEVLETLRTTLVPAVLKNLANIPIPKLEGSNEDYDYSVDNIVFNAYDLLPENVFFVMNSGTHLELKKRDAHDLAQAEILLRISDFSINLQNFDFFFQRKTFPKIEDAGTANVSVGGNTKFSVIWRLVTELGRPTQVSLAYVDVSIDSFKVNILHSEKHEWLLKFVTSVFSGLIAKRIEKVVEEKMKDYLLTFNDQINETLREWNQKTKEFGQKTIETIAEKTAM